MIKKILLFVGVLVIACIVFIYYQYTNTKSYSPEVTSTFTEGNLNITLFYNSPRKKGRIIFGELVPYNSLWRFGANEPTTWEANQKVHFGEHILPAGKYSLWAIPGQMEWSLFFHPDVPFWGVGSAGSPGIDIEKSTLRLTSPVSQQEEITEEFTLRIDKNSDHEKALVVMWDQTMVSFPFTTQQIK